MSVKSHRATLEVWLAPGATKALDDAARSALSEATIVEVLGSEPVALAGPAVVVLTPADLVGPARAELLALNAHALPGRPVLYAGTSTKDVLLDAINVWHVARVVPEIAGPAAVVDAIRKSWDATLAGLALTQAAVDLEHETHQLEAALSDVEATREHLLRSERLSTVGRIAGGLISAARPDLQELLAFREVTGGRTPDPELASVLDQAFDGIELVERLLDELRAYADNRATGFHFFRERIDLLVARAVGFQRFDPMARERTLLTRLDSQAVVRVDRHRLLQVLVNLIRNAVQATTSHGTIEVSTRDVDADWVEIAVKDDGEGMSAATQSRLFDPFFSTKGEDGMGMGLVMSRTIVEQHGGIVTMTSSPGHGTTVFVRIPTIPC